MIKINMLAALLLSVSATTVSAQLAQYEGGYNPSQSLEEYFAASDENENKSIIYVFFNNEPCENCAQAIELIENIYNDYYADEYSLFLINYAEDGDYNFIETYNLSQPLEVVLVRINDGASFGFQKIEDLQNQVDDSAIFTSNFTNEVNDFLGNGTSGL